MKKIICVAVCMLMTVQVFGQSISWEIKNGTLILRGTSATGVMPDYDYSGTNGVLRNPPPWYERRKEITAVEFHNITSIGNEAFAACSNITSITLPDGLTRIGKYAFQSCLNLTSITIPASVTTIGKYAFQGCNLTSITIPASVTTIGEEFCMSYSLTSIEVDNANPNYSSEDGVLYNKDKTALIYYPGGKEGSKFIIPDGVKRIENLAFQVAAYLSSITIPASVTSIGGNAFSCSYLTGIEVQWEMPIFIEVNYFSNAGFSYYNSDLSTLTLTVPAGAKSNYENADGWKYFGLIVEKGAENTSFAVGNGLIGTISSDWTLTISGIGAIPDNVFNKKAFAEYKFNEIVAIEIQEGVTGIGQYAFQGCQKLASVAIPQSVTTIDDGAFWVCRSLTSVTIPSGVTKIGVWAFGACYGLTRIEVQMGKPLIINKNVFGYTDISQITLVVPPGKKELYSKGLVWKDFGVIEEQGSPNAVETFSNAKIWSSGGNLHISAPVATSVSIYTLSGALYKQQTVGAGQTAIPLPPGIYVVKVGKEMVKVVVG